MMSDLQESLDQFSTGNDDVFAKYQNLNGFDPSLFNFPHRPIEKEALKLEELEIVQRLNRKRKETLDLLSNQEIKTDYQNDVNTELFEKELPFYQRVNVGESVGGVPIDELNQAGELLCEALFIRAKYMALSLQSFNPITARSLQTVNEKYSLKDFYDQVAEENIDSPRSMCVLQENENLTPCGSIWKPYICDVPGDSGYQFELINGVFRVYDNKVPIEKSLASVIHPMPCIEEFMEDQKVLLSLSTHGPIKSFTFRRLQFLESKFKLHCLLNDVKENAAQKEIVHRDFYNVRKVDTHIHAASCMNQKHLLRFIKKKS